MYDALERNIQDDELDFSAFDFLRRLGCRSETFFSKSATLLQNLQVRPASNGKFEVVAGGRRLASLKLLAKMKKINKAEEIPCHVLDGEDATEINLAENMMRLPMHPADQFEAFRAMIETGKGIEDVAARRAASGATRTRR